MRRKTRLLIVAIPTALLVVAFTLAFWSAERTLNRSARIALKQHQLGFTLRALDSGATQPQNAGFESVGSSSAFTCGAFFDGDLYLAGPSGLSIYSSQGTLRRSLRTGLELPVSPIVAVSSGRLRGASDPQLLLATAGAGLLLLDPNAKGSPTLHQLLPDSAASRDLTALLPLSSGDLLLGTHHSGVLLFNGSVLTPVAVDADALDITALASVDSASFLIGTRNSGVFYVHAGTTQHVNASSGLPDDQVESIAVANGQAYVGTPLGVAQFDLNSALKPSRILAPGTFSHALAFDPSTAQLLIGTLDQGVQQLAVDARPRLRNAAFSRDSSESAGERVDQFLSAAGPSGIYAVAQGRLLRRDTSDWSPMLDAASAPGLADRNISALAFAPDGSLYVGFFDHGLDILPADSTARIRHLEDDHLFCVNRLVLDPRLQTIAAATANGLVLFDRQGMPRQVLTHRDGLISDHVSDVAYTRTGMTLATPAGLTTIGPGGIESLYAFQGLVNNHVYALSGTTGSDRLLAGTLGGLSLLDSGAVQRNLTAANSGLKHNWITALVPSPEGGWLIGTYGAGVLTLSADGNRFTSIELPAGTSRDLVINPNALLVTGTHIYAGTLGHGLLVLDRATSRWTVITSGLPSLNVTAFAERNGELYVGTENGLVRIPEARL